MICIGALLVWCRRPAGEQVQRLLRLRAGLGGVDEHRQAGIGDELHRLVREVSSPTTGWWKRLTPGVVPADVVRGPERPERLAPRRQLADEVGEVAVVRDRGRLPRAGRRRRRSRRGPSRRRSVGARGSRKTNRAVFGGCAGLSKCWEYRARPRRFAPRMSSRPLRTNAGTPDIASSMCCTVGRIRCCARRRLRGVDVCAARARSNRWARSASSSCSARASASSTVSETPARVAALEPRVVVDADAGEQRHLFAPETGDAARAGAVGGQTGLVGRDPAPAWRSGTRGSRSSCPRRRE